MKNLIETSQRVLLPILLLFIFSALHAQTRENLTFDGKNRSMIVYTPKELPENAPLVITLHGFNQSAQYQMEHTKWNTVADTAKFVVVYPDYEGGWWDVNGTKDTRFIEHIMKLMNERHKVDLNRVYISGFSLGAMMTYHCIEVLANKVAAFAPVSGVRFDNKAPYSTRMVPIIHTHCKGDDVFKWEGDPQHASGGYPYIPDYVKSWAEYFGMNPKPDFIDPYPANKSNSDVDLTIYRRDDSVVEVRLLSFDGAGHWHVDADAWGGVSTTQEIWNFCKRYTLDLKDVEPPVLIKAEPEDCSFDLPDTQREFTLTFDRAAWKTNMSAKLTGNSKTINLLLKTPEIPDGLKTSTPTFLIPENETIAPGDYTLTIDGIGTSEDFTRSISLEYSYGYEETGDELKVETIFEQNLNALLPAANGCIPEGWQRVNTLTNGKTETLNSSTTPVESGSCLKEIGEGTAGIFLTARDIASCNMNYGRDAGNLLYLPVGKYTIHFDASYWDASSQRGKAEFDVHVHSKSNRGGYKIPLDQKALKPEGVAGKNGANWASAAAHCQFDMKVDKKDNYVINFNASKPKTAVCLGNVKLTTAPTNADKYKGEFLRLLQTAKKQYEQALESGSTAGLAELKAVIEKHEGLTSTAPSVYTAAMKELQAALEQWGQIVTSIGAAASSAAPVSTQYFTIDGRRMPAPEKGIAIRRMVYGDGKVVIKKIKR